MNRVYWITGLSGAGKTTIGSALYAELKKETENVVFLDGDALRRVFGDKYGYSESERLSLGMTYARLCRLLSNQGFIVICCTIAMFDEIRAWNRKNIPDYIEVYLRVSLDVLRKRDQKGLYSGSNNQNGLDLVGLDIKMEEPKNPDIIIDNDGAFSVGECVNRILEYKVDKDFYEDKKYWDTYYSTNPPINHPSKFAEYTRKYLAKGKSLADLGCGNGRDSLYFSDIVSVTAIDGSEHAIYKLKRDHGFKEISFICGDFVDSTSLYGRNYDYFYTRFSLHSITEDKQHILLRNIYDHLEYDGFLFIEARGVNDELYGKGEMVGRNAFFFDSHYRRFIVRQELDAELRRLGFNIILSEEDRGFAPFGNSDPFVIRIIAKK